MIAKPFIEDSEDLYQNAPFGYMSMRADGLIVNINTTLLVWLGYERDEILLQKSFQDLLGMGERIYFETHMMPMLQMQGEISEISIELKGKQPRKLPTLINGKRIIGSSDDKPFYRFSVLNITQRKQYEVELIKARKKAEQTVDRLKQINEGLEQFAYTASHDLQAPLNTISGLMGLLDKEGYLPPGSQGEMYYSLILNNTQRMKQMIKDLLDYSKMEGNEKGFEEVSLNEACKIALGMLEDQAKENNATFTIGELPVIFADKIQVFRLFQNLFSNALKYRSEADPIVTVSFEDKGDQITVYVKDNGIGFKQDASAKIFGFMKRLDPHGSIQGTGIGLSACKRILEIHGGKIAAISEPGKGSTFYFTIPKIARKRDY
ncbi:ATP-binding protein [uncultured Cyclobacterium sp.]|uniref:sensor histidine kinase n=1 Tax=uncultured Cyclobacterium sp. TaxID=453820 RepID=UPI0030EB23FF